MTHHLTRLAEPDLGSSGPSCERCHSLRIQWLTPRDRVLRGAMLFCDDCSHLTIITRRHMMHAANLLLAA
ncbi:MAG: hypothetical protein JO023_04085 [Chloroflexi bacterium]|nr:hypothetical protein [Chloroflexota bacterium]